MIFRLGVMRIDWIDRWRGALIVCIVLFHVIGMVQIYAGDSFPILGIVKRTISTFHVVSFFAVSAVLWKSRDANAMWTRFLGQKAFRLLVPYAAFGSLMCGVFWLASWLGAGSAADYAEVAEASWWTPLVSLALGKADRAVGPLWFLPCLFVVTVLYRSISPYMTSRRRLCLAALAFFSLRFAVQLLQPPYVMFNLWMSFDYLVYFCLARAFIPREIPAWIRRCRVVGLLAGGVFLAFAGGECPWSLISGASLWIYPSKVVRGCCGLFGFLCLVQSVDGKWLSRVGRDTLGILVMHKFVIVAVQFACARAGVFAALSMGQAVAFVVVLSTVTITLSMAGTSVVRRVCPMLLGEEVHR